jgi:predicted MPP superfamily phosphohydrolase
VGCFAIHGNHDSYQIGAELRDSQVKFLDGRRHVVDLPGGQVELIGLPGRRRIELLPEFVDSLPRPQADVPRIILSHFPDHLIRTAVLQPDLFLAGHTHGGQICFPGGGPLIWHDKLPRRLSRGAHRVGDTWLVVSRGLGATGLPIRVFCTPEVVEIRLVEE